MLEKLWNFFILKYKRCEYGKKLCIRGRFFVYGKKMD